SHERLCLLTLAQYLAWRLQFILTRFPAVMHQEQVMAQNGNAASSPRVDRASGPPLLPPFRLPEKKRRTKLWIVLIGLTIALLGLSLWLMGPAPPRKFFFATGQEGGGYDTFGKQYRTRLGKMGLEVDLVNTNGSIDNLHRLVNGEVDVALVQAGT